MKHIMLPLLTFLMLFSVNNSVFSQADSNSTVLKKVNTTDSVTTKKPRLTKLVKNGEGTEFYICFMINFNEDNRSNARELDLSLFISSDFNTKVVIEFPKLNQRQEIQIKAGEVVKVRLDQTSQSTLFEMEDIGQAIHITSDRPISVYGLNRRKQTTDSFLAFPVEVLGTDHLIMSYYSFNTDLQSTFAIVATEDSTIVDITPSVTTSSGKKAGEKWTVTMNKGSVYMVGAYNRTSKPQQPTDLTGTQVSSNRPIAVFGGHQCAVVPSPVVTACNLLAEQLPPINTWGKTFYIGAFKSRSYYTYRVLASQDSTKVFEDTTLIGILNKGEFIQRNSRKNIQIIADKPVLVAQYSQGSANGDNIGDPMMILITPVQQYLNKYRFATPVNGEWVHYVNVFVPSKSIGSFRVNGKPINEDFFERFGNTKYSIASIRLPYGSHTVECNQPFGLYNYGFGIQFISGFQGPDAYDAYGTMGGQSFIDYQPVPDVNPPMADAIIGGGNKQSIIVSDDGRDDLGIAEIEILYQANMTTSIPNFTSGAPSVIIACQPQDANIAASMVFKATDIATNSEIYTVCYVYDNTTNRFVLLVNKGNNPCAEENRWVIGALAGITYNSFNSDNMKLDIDDTGKLLNYYGLKGRSNTLGISIGRHIFSSFNVIGKFIFASNEATFTSADTIKKFVLDSISNNKLPYYTANKIDIKNITLDVAIGLDWKLSDFVYLSGGFLFNFALNKKADLYNKLLFPPGYEFLDETSTSVLGTTKKIANEFSSLSTFNLGFYIGPGLICSIGRGFQLFLDLNYFYYPFSILNSNVNDLFKDKISLNFGLKYQI